MDLLAQLAEGIFPNDAKERIVAMLFGYFDESGTDGQHGFTVITGFIGPVHEWSNLVHQWDARLLKDRIETFHYIECKSRQKQYYGWDWQQDCKPHLEALSDIIIGHGVAGLNAGFLGDYSAFLKTVPAEFGEHFPTAYSFCFWLLIARIRAACKQWRPEPIALIFARQNEFQGRALQQWNEAKEAGLWTEISHIGYAEPKDIHQLQTADMLAWETRRYMWDKTPLDGIRDLPLLSKLTRKEREVGNSLYEAAMDADRARIAVNDAINEGW